MEAGRGGRIVCSTPVRPPVNGSSDQPPRLLQGVQYSVSGLGDPTALYPWALFDCFLFFPVSIKFSFSYFCFP